MHPNIELPTEYIEQISPMLSADELQAFIKSCQTPLRKSIRINTLKISVAEFLHIAQQKSWQLTPIPWCKEGFWIEDNGSQQALGNSFEHMAGLFYIQEASSMLPPVALLEQASLSADHKILDMASAPGSKSTQIAAIMNNQGLLVTNELSSSRLKVLHHNLTRCGVTNYAITHFDAKVFGEYTAEQFDFILLDAPCSGEGAIRKDPQAMSNWSLESTKAIAKLQTQLIESAFYALKPGGTLIYSTCTLNSLENQQVANHLLDSFESSIEVQPLNNLFKGAESCVTSQGFLHVFPHIYDSEGFFVARFKKRCSVATPQPKTKKGKLPFTPLSTSLTQTLQQHLSQELSLNIDHNNLSLWQRDKEIWLFPKAIHPLLETVRFQRIGLKIAQTHTKGFKWDHNCIVTLANQQQCSSISLDNQQASDWYQGKDIRPLLISAQQATKKGYVLVSFQNQIIGLGKWVGSRIKNGLPRELVKDGVKF